MEKDVVGRDEVNNLLDLGGGGRVLVLNHMVHRLGMKLL